jgi:Zn-dependent peptidase ImmA (M78 family)
VTLNWSVAHRMAMMAANQTHRDVGVARDDYIDVFAALEAIGVCCVAQPLRGLAGAYAAPEADGPAVILSSRLDEITMRHTAAHELGHHAFLHGSKVDERVDPDSVGLGGSWPDEEKLAEAFAPWFLMPLPAVRTAIRRSGADGPVTPADIHQIACWLGASYAGTARHLANLKMLTGEEAASLVRTWRARGDKIRAALALSSVPPPGRVWVMRAEGDQASLHVLTGDTLVYSAEEPPLPLPAGLTVGEVAQPTIDGLASAVVTSGLARPADFSTTAVCGARIAVRLLPPPCRVGISTEWRRRAEDIEQDP